MDQLHKRFTADQVRVLLQGYRQGTMSRAEVEEMLNIGKTRFFALLKEYQQSPATFAIAYERGTPARLSGSVEAAIGKALLREKELVDDPRLPISDYNYSALRDRLKKTGVTVSATTITDRAKKLDCYKPHRERGLRQGGKVRAAQERPRRGTVLGQTATASRPDTIRNRSP